MTRNERAYLSVIEWPETFGEAERVEALSAGAGMDAHRARLAVRQAPPTIVALIDAAGRDQTLQQLRSRGVVATAPTRAELDRLPQPIPAKRFTEAVGSDGRLYMIEPWHGESRGLRTEDIRLLIRAGLRRTQTRIRRDPGAGRAAAAGYMIGGVVGAMAAGDDAVERSTRTRVTELLDIYTSDQQRIRVNGEKFGFDCLGDARAYSDKANLDSLAVRLAERCPRAYIDTSFGSFRPPPDIRVHTQISQAATAARRRDDLAAFDFYSPWFAVAYSALLRSAKR